jgi:hypothetical protein
MQRDSKDNTREKKEITRKKYIERNIDKWVKWSWDIKGNINYKQLKEKQDEYGIRSESWRKHS